MERQFKKPRTIEEIVAENERRLQEEARKTDSLPQRNIKFLDDIFTQLITKRD